MLLNNLFTYDHLSGEDVSSLRFKVNINASSEIFQGHFPDNPITPGACQLEMVKEVLSDYLGQKVGFDSITDLKFISMWIPNESEEVFMDISAKSSETGYKVKASIYTESTTYFKLRGNADVG